MTRGMLQLIIYHAIKRKLKTKKITMIFICEPPEAHATLPVQSVYDAPAYHMAQREQIVQKLSAQLTICLWYASAPRGTQRVDH